MESEENQKSAENPIIKSNGPLYSEEGELFRTFQAYVKSLAPGKYPLREKYYVTLKFIFKGHLRDKGEEINLTDDEYEYWQGNIKRQEISHKENTIKMIEAYMDFYSLFKNRYPDEPNPYRDITCSINSKGNAWLIIN